MDSRAFRNCLGKFATGITIVTARLGDNTPVGITVNSFTSVSLEPPLVLFCLDKKAQSFDAFGLSSSFVFNILSTDQEDLSKRFASQGIDKFKGVDFTLNTDQIPVLSSCLANIHCQMHAIHDGGDHQIIVGEVTHFEDNIDVDMKPLLYYGGAYNYLKL